METQKIYHGWFSYKQYSQNKKLYYYLSTSNTQVALTEISSDDPDKFKSGFDDSVYKGTFTKYIKTQKG